MKYELTTLNDVYHKVPADKIMECFKELAVTFMQAADIRDLIAKQAKEAGIELEFDKIIELPESHTWIDDGLGTIDIELSHGDEKILDMRTKI